MSRLSVAALATALVSSSFAQTTLTGNFLEANVSAVGVLLSSGVGGMKYNWLGTGGGTGLEYNNHGYPSYAHTIVANGTSFTRYSGGTFGGGFVGINVTNTSIGNVQSANVRALTSNGLLLNRTYQFTDGSSVIEIIDNYTNTTSSAMTLATIDSWDPDQGIPQGLGFNTSNDVSAAQDFVTAWSGLYGVKFYGGDNRSRANVVSYGLESYNPFDPLYDPNGLSQDLGISVQWDLGTLRAGETVCANSYIEFQAVPDPATFALVAMGIGGTLLRRRNKK